VPYSELAKDVGKDMLVSGLRDFVNHEIKEGALKSVVAAGLEETIAAGPFTAYKVADLSMDIGLAATERQDKTLGAEMIMVKADAALLRGLHEQGVDLSSDPRAVAAKERLSAIAETMGPGDRGTGGYLLEVVANNFPYAVTKVGVDQGFEKALGWILSRSAVTRLIERVLPLGRMTSAAIGNRSILQPVLHSVGWRQFGTRARIAEKIVQRYTEKAIDKSVEDIIKRSLKNAENQALSVVFDDLYGEALANHPPKPVVHHFVRLEVARLKLRPLPLRHLPRRDPVASTICTEDYASTWCDGDGGGSDSSSSSSESSAAEEHAEIDQHESLHISDSNLGDWLNHSFDGNNVRIDDSNE
jgi:hypothetical protein